MLKYGFVYLWFDRKHKRYYIGCHWGSVDDGYICSSTWMRNAYKRRTSDFKRRILKTNIVDRKQLLLEEYKYLLMIKDEEIGKKYYNLTKHLNGHWTADGNLLTVGEKISKAKTGNCSGENNAFFGKHHSDETKLKIKEKRKTQIFNDETRRKLSISHSDENNAFFGKHHSDETKSLLKKHSLNFWSNDEYRNNQSLLKKGRVIINNGVETKMVFPNEIPVGWTKGRIKNGS